VHELGAYCAGVDSSSLVGSFALKNIAATGFAQPLTYATPSRLVYLGILPSSLMSAAVAATFFDRGLKELEITPAADLLWRQAWRSVRHHA